MQKGAAARSLLFEAGGPLAKELARHGVALKVNDWLFAHGGIMPHHVEYGLERINHEVSNWMKHANNRWGQPTKIPFIAIRGFDSMVWSRLYSHETFENPEDKIQACALLSAALVAANMRGLVVLEITDTKVRVLRMAGEFLQEDDTVKGWYTRAWISSE
ncbi:unnamed protein product [Sphagnum troendelagicum]|uniref:Uncharacterized protein n=1 Tax=Sphagnum troendelagicum TaxID=128251 RepID=A0ABP0U9G0_9BRYO